MIKRHGQLPVTWDIEEFKTLRYEFGFYNSNPPLKTLIDAGHDVYRITNWKCHYPNAMPESVNRLEQHWPEMSNVGIAVNLLTPGQYLPPHQDQYGRYRNSFNLTNNDTIARVLIMAQDSAPGQMFQVHGETYGNWKAGEWFAWINSEWHATYNFSNVNRYAIQITGSIA
jgi:hypothetical protein